MKISLSRLIAGWAFMLAGILFMILSVFISLWMLVYGISFLVVGIVLLLNKDEDKIEKRKDLKEKEYKK
jgi:lipopolysaccharide export LptBFGC system permease protein LptF